MGEDTDNISRLRLIARQLDNAYEQLDTFFEISTDLLVIIDPRGFYTRLSRSWEDVTGFSRLELTSRPFLTFICDDSHDDTLDQMKKLEGGATDWDFTNRHTRKDGGWVLLHWRSKEVDDLIYAVARVIEIHKGTGNEKIRHY